MKKYLFLVILLSILMLGFVSVEAVEEDLGTVVDEEEYHWVERVFDKTVSAELHEEGYPISGFFPEHVVLEKMTLYLDGMLVVNEGIAVIGRYLVFSDHPARTLYFTYSINADEGVGYSFGLYWHRNNDELAGVMIDTETKEEVEFEIRFVVPYMSWEKVEPERIPIDWGKIPSAIGGGANETYGALVWAFTHPYTETAFRIGVPAVVIGLSLLGKKDKRKLLSAEDRNKELASRLLTVGDKVGQLTREIFTVKEKEDNIAKEIQKEKEEREIITRMIKESAFGMGSTDSKIQIAKLYDDYVSKSKNETPITTAPKVEEKPTTSTVDELIKQEKAKKASQKELLNAYEKALKTNDKSKL